MTSQKPLFKHECTSCTFLGTSSDNKADLYFCPQSGSPTIIARYSDDGPDYISGAVFAKDNQHLAEAKERAENLGFKL